MKILQKAIFKFRFKFYSNFKRFFRINWLRFMGMKIGNGTNLSTLHITWPHQVALGANCQLEHQIYFKFDGVWSAGASIDIKSNVFIGHSCEFNIRKHIEIGCDTLIASGCKFIDHDHGVSLKGLMRTQEGPESAIKIGENVWLGSNVIVLKGVQIGDGAVVAAGSVVTKSIDKLEIWAGIPAKKIGLRS